MDKASQSREMSSRLWPQNAARKARAKLRHTAGIVRALYAYYKCGQIPHHRWMMLLNAHCATNGRATEHLNLVTRLLRPPRKATPAVGLLGRIDVAELNNVCGVLRRDGYYVFPNRISAETF